MVKATPRGSASTSCRGAFTGSSGGGYTVMQLLVEDVTGKPFAQYMHEAVLAPLGMTSSTYQQPLSAGSRRAHGVGGPLH